MSYFLSWFCVAATMHLGVLADSAQSTCTAESGCPTFNQGPDDEEATSLLMLPKTESTTKTTTWMLKPEGQLPRSYPPPLYRVNAHSLYDAGFQHGTIARDRIQAWFAVGGMKKLARWVGIPEDPNNHSYCSTAEVCNATFAEGRNTYLRIREDNEKEFPEYAAETQGISDGSGIPLDMLWLANILLELDFAMTGLATDRCSDVYAVARGGYKNGFAHGHNEDEYELAMPLYYFVSYTYKPKPGKDNKPFTSCAGLSFPGSVFGSSPQWNVHGMYSTQNTVHFPGSRKYGLSSTMLQRRAICESRSMAETIEILRNPRWSLGASMNMLDLRGKVMANMEIWEDITHTHWVTEEASDHGGNYSHFNSYKHMDNLTGYWGTSHRQSMVDALPPSRSVEDVKQRLSLVQRPSPWTPSHASIASLIVDGHSGILSLWSGGVKPNSTVNPPSYNWNLHHFFDDDFDMYKDAQTWIHPNSDRHH